MDYTFFEVPVTPKGKGRPRFMRNGHTYTPKATAEYEQTIRDWFVYRVHGEKHDGPLDVELEFLMPIPRSWSRAKVAAAMNGQIEHTGKPDVDNMVKAVLDALNKTAWKDDSQIVNVKASKRYSIVPRVCVTIRHSSANGSDG